MKVIVFDLYHTLLQVNHQSYFFRNLFKAVQQEIDYSFSGYQRLLMKNDITAVFELLPDKFRVLYHENFSKLEEELAAITLYPEVLDCLGALQHKFDLYLISNLATPYKAPFFDKGLNLYFKDALFSCDLGYMKPQRAIFQELENRFQLNKQDVLMIGDSFKSDYKGAMANQWSALQLNRKGRKLRKFEIRNITEVLDRF